MNRLQVKSDAIRSWLQFVLAPVASLWVAAAIADSRSTSVLMLGLLIGLMLSVSVYFLARKITDGFWMVFVSFVVSAIGIAAVFSIGNKLGIGDVSANRGLFFAIPPVAVLSLANRFGKIKLPNDWGASYQGSAGFDFARKNHEREMEWQRYDAHMKRVHEKAWRSTHHHL